jgi:hypothetical protein
MSRPPYRSVLHMTATALRKRVTVAGDIRHLPAWFKIKIGPIAYLGVFI